MIRQSIVQQIKDDYTTHQQEDQKRRFPHQKVHLQVIQDGESQEIMNKIPKISHANITPSNNPAKPKDRDTTPNNLQLNQDRISKQQQQILWRNIKKINKYSLDLLLKVNNQLKPKNQAKQTQKTEVNQKIIQPVEFDSQSFIYIDLNNFDGNDKYCHYYDKQDYEYLVENTGQISKYNELHKKYIDSEKKMIHRENATKVKLLDKMQQSSLFQESLWKQYYKDKKKTAGNQKEESNQNIEKSTLSSPTANPKIQQPFLGKQPDAGDVSQTVNFPHESGQNKVIPLTQQQQVLTSDDNANSPLLKLKNAGGPGNNSRKKMKGSQDERNKNQQNISFQLNQSINTDISINNLNLSQNIEPSQIMLTEPQQLSVPKKKLKIQSAALKHETEPSQELVLPAIKQAPKIWDDLGNLVKRFEKRRVYIQQNRDLVNQSTDKVLQNIKVQQQMIMHNFDKYKAPYRVRIKLAKDFTHILDLCSDKLKL